MVFYRLMENYKTKQQPDSELATRVKKHENEFDSGATL
jgi:hypothetical protein